MKDSITAARGQARFKRGIRKPKCRLNRECDYVYRDIHRESLFIKIRYRHDPCICGRGKSFQYAWHRDPEKPWISEHEKPPWADTYLYRLDEWWLDWRYGKIKEVMWTEGEKDADALARTHFPATTHHQGAGNATPAQAAWFTAGKNRGSGRIVTIVADLDDAGAYCAAQRHDLLLDAGFRGSIRIVRAAAGNDAADHLAAGYYVREFVPVDYDRLAEAASRHKSDLKGNTERYMNGEG